jgi:hypothetical protein
MPTDPQTLKRLVDDELGRLSDARVVNYARSLLVEPTVTMRRWEYGHEGEQYPCWTILRHPSSNTGIAYCEQGFGPRSPWGLVFLEGDPFRTSIGMDCSWYPTFLRAFFDSKAISDLAIWRVFKTDAATGVRQAISDEGAWDAIWAQVMALRESDPAGRYDCWTNTDEPSAFLDAAAV